MTENEPGKALTEARIARGLSLLDVERDTRISNRYLKALEEGQYDVLPAPVYARAFMRTYAQYLGLDAQSIVSHMPGGRPEPAMAPLPDYDASKAAPVVSPNWLIAGGVILVLLVVGVVIFWNAGTGGGGDTTSVIGRPTEPGAGGPQPVAPTEAPTEAAPEDATPTDVPPPTVEAGIVPDLEAQNVLTALSALAGADIPYLIIELELDGVAESDVFRQSPSPGTQADDDTVVTLLVGR